MKRLLQSTLVAILIVVVGFTAVSCSLFNKDKNEGITEPAAVDKAALNAEIALEITEQGDYSNDSYNAYAAKLAEAKAVANDEEATQEAVDAALAALSAARAALAIKPIEEVEGGNKAFRLISGDSKEITLSDYVNANGLSKITYEVKTSNAVVELSKIADGKFTITAGDVRKETDVVVSIIVSYDGAEKLKVELNVKITNDVTPVLKNEAVEKNVDIFDLENKESLVIDFAENVDNAGNLELTYSVKCGEEVLSLNGTRYTLTLGSYTDEFAYQTFTVTVSYTANGASGTVEYTYKLGIRDTAAYRALNGSFNNGLDGWTVNNTLGEAPFGGIDEKTTYWVQNFPMNNIGKYFSAYADGASEASQGTLTSSFFKVHSKYATYMLGGAGNRNVYITIEDETGKVLALYRNTEFKDFTDDIPEADRFAMVGETIFLANFVTYKVDISEFEGQKIRFVIHDYASSGWGVVFFDELTTYYASENEVSEGAVLAENLLANKSALDAELALEITAQGDYTEASYNAYLEKLAAAKALAGDVAATEAEVNAATEALANARAALTVRPVLEVEGANKSFKLFSGNSQAINIADYINENGLSKITYAVQANSAAITLSEIADGKFTITAGNVDEATVETVSIIVYYDGVEKLTVALSVEITNDLAPTVKKGEIVKSFDLYLLENKANIALDLSENVDNAGNLELTYYVNGVAADELYTFTFGDSYNSEVTYETFTVTVSYIANGEAGSIEYTYKLAIIDSTECRLENGGFENGLDGWTQAGEIGNVSSNGSYWNGDFGMDGEKMFSAYEPSDMFEKNFGTLTSSTFVVGGSGFVTFKIGAMKDDYRVYLDVIDADTKEILARYYNGLWVKDVTHCTLVAYKADLSAFKGREVYFRISDYASSDYGLFFADSFVTYYEAEPDGFNAATPVNYVVSGTIYDVVNGGFETGDTQGWWNDGEPGVVTGANKFFDNIEYGKEGNFLYAGTENCDDEGKKLADGREGNQGYLTSSVFEIGGSGWISFLLGGGGNQMCYVQVIDANTGKILGKYRQQAQNSAVLIQHYADLSAHIGKSVRLQVVDLASSEWGCVSFDNVITYYETAPDTSNGHVAPDIKYEIANGSFELGNLQGWKQNITWSGDGQNTLGWVLDSEISGQDWYKTNDDRKDGNYLFTFCQPNNNNCENNTGTLDSSVFTLKQNSYVSFRFGGAGTRGVRIQLCKANGEVIATFYNEAPGKVNTEMYAYYYQYTGEETDCFFRIVDDQREGDSYRCFVVDDFRVNLESAPEGFIAAIQ